MNTNKVYLDQLTTPILSAVLAIGLPLAAWSILSSEYNARGAFDQYVAEEGIQFTVVQIENGAVSAPLFVGTYTECKEKLSEFSSIKSPNLSCFALNGLHN